MSFEFDSTGVFQGFQLPAWSAEGGKQVARFNGTVSGVGPDINLAERVVATPLPFEP